MNIACAFGEPLNSPLSARMADLAARWEKLVDIDPRRHEPGFFGAVPYILILRYFIALAVTFRFWLHRAEYRPDQWTSRCLIIALIAIATATATNIAFNHRLRRSQILQAGFILVDIGFISVAYWLTRNPESDFFLLYYLPIFAAVEYLSVKGIAAVYVIVGAAIATVVFSMQPALPAAWTTHGLVWRVLIPRGVFFLTIVLTSAFAFQALSRRQVALRGLLDSLHLVSAAAAPSVLALDDAVDFILSRLTETLKFEFATISLVDEYRSCIETVRGRNVPPGWVRRAKHALISKDIQSDVVRTGNIEIIEGWDDRFDRAIYDRFEHSRFARVFVPIISTDHYVVGTIEAGCVTQRRAEVITEATIAEIQRLGREKGGDIARSRAHVLLEVIAERAIGLIGADSASLHVYRQVSHNSSATDSDDWGELILAAGAGRATHEFVQEFQPRSLGRGRTAIRTGKPQWLDDPQRFAQEYPSLYAQGIRAVAAIPLALGPDTNGVLGVHFWQRGKHFTLQELNLAELFAREMEVVIQNHLLFTRATEVGGRAWALSGLQSLTQSLTSPFHLSDVLKKIAKSALLTLDANNVVVYQYHADDNTFDVPPVMEGDFLAPPPLKLKVRPDDMLFKIIRAGTSQFIFDAPGHPLLCEAETTDGARFVERQAVRSCAILVLRPGGAEEIVGLTFVNFRGPHEFSAEEKRVMYALATSAALAIRTARLHKADVVRQLEAMHAVNLAIAEKGPDLKQVLERLLEMTLELTGAKYGQFMWFNRHTQDLESMARCGMPAELVAAPQKLGEGVIGLAAQSKRSILIEDVEDINRSIFVDGLGEVLVSDAYKKVNRDTRCELAVPLVDDGQVVLGVLNVEHTQPRGLSEDAKSLLERLAVPAIIAVHTVDLYKRLGRRIKHLSSLNIIAARTQEKPYELDTIFRLFLTGITAGEGLGFSRAMLFLVDEQGTTLFGRSAIGARTRAEAEEIWQTIPLATSSLYDLNSLLKQAEQLSEQIKVGSIGSSLGRAVEQVRLPIDSGAGAPARCLLNGKTVTIGYGEADPFRELMGRFTEPNDLPHAFACVPLVGKQKKWIGALVVDNRFLLTEREIDDEDIAGLEAFGRLLALSVEYSPAGLFEEQTAGIAHIVGSRISAMAGKVTRLRNCLEALRPNDFAVELQGLLDGLRNGISRAELVLTDFRRYATSQMVRKRIDLGAVLTNVYEDVHGSYPFDIELAADPLPVWADALRLSNAIMAVIQNAHEATAGRANPLIRVKATAHRSATGSQAYAEVEITDNGPGIDDKIKKNGTGLGLAIAKKVIVSHGGTIEPDTIPGSGARFVIRIPTLTDSEDRSKGEADGQNSCSR
jgi:GAF domain-containing protein